MTIDHLIYRIDKLIVDIQATYFPEALIVAGNDLAALIKQRVRSTGKTSTGGMFSSYSPGYAEFRRKKNRQTEFKNFELTGTMWREFGITQKEQKQVIIAEKTSAEEEKLIENTERENQSIIAPSEQEGKMIVETIRERIINAINNDLGE